MDTSERVRLIADLRKQADLGVNRVVPDLHRSFDRLGQHVEVTCLAQGGVLLEATDAERRRASTIAAASALIKWTKENLGPMYRTIYMRTGELTMQVLSRHGVPATLRRKLEAKLLAEGGKQMGLLDIAQETKETIFDVMDKAREDGINPRQAARLVREHVPAGRFVNAGSKYRSELIARTEVLNAQRQASLDGYRQAEITLVQAFDGESDEECSARNGEDFTLADAQIEADSTHPQCVLGFAPY